MSIKKGTFVKPPHEADYSLQKRKKSALPEYGRGIMRSLKYAKGNYGY